MVNITMLVRDRYALTSQALLSFGSNMNGVGVTLFDDRSRDDVKHLVHGWSLVYGAQLVRNESQIGTGAARNAVINASEATWGRGDYLYLSDNDVFFHRGWLERLISCYETSRHYGFSVLGAYNHPYHQPIDGEQRVKVGNLEVYPVMALALQSMLMTWDVWYKYGPFKETEEGKVCQGEDVDFGNAIRADGGRLGVVSPPLLVNCGITNSFGERIPGWELVKAQCPAGVICE